MFPFLPYILPPTYEVTAISEQRNSDDFKFGKITFFDSRENILLNNFASLGGSIANKQAIEKFLKDSPIVYDNLIKTSSELSKIFNYDDFSNLRLEYMQVSGEKPELFLIVETKYSVEEAMDCLGEFDNWFVPNVFKNFSRFNVNIDFI